MGFLLSVAVTCIISYVVIILTKMYHSRWGKGQYTSGKVYPVIVGVVAGLSFCIGIDVAWVYLPPG